MGSTTKNGKSEMGQILGDGWTEMENWNKFCGWREYVILLEGELLKS